MLPRLLSWPATRRASTKTGASTSTFVWVNILVLLNCFALQDVSTFLASTISIFIQEDFLQVDYDTAAPRFLCASGSTAGVVVPPAIGNIQEDFCASSSTTLTKKSSSDDFSTKFFAMAAQLLPISEERTDEDVPISEERTDEDMRYFLKHMEHQAISEDAVDHGINSDVEQHDLEQEVVAVADSDKEKTRSNSGLFRPPSGQQLEEFLAAEGGQKDAEQPSPQLDAGGQHGVASTPFFQVDRPSTTVARSLRELVLQKAHQQEQAMFLQQERPPPKREQDLHPADERDFLRSSFTFSGEQTLRSRRPPTIPGVLPTSIQMPFLPRKRSRSVLSRGSSIAAASESSSAGRTKHAKHHEAGGNGALAVLMQEHAESRRQLAPPSGDEHPMIAASQIAFTRMLTPIEEEQESLRLSLMPFFQHQEDKNPVALEQHQSGNIMAAGSTSASSPWSAAGATTASEVHHLQRDGTSRPPTLIGSASTAIDRMLSSRRAAAGFLLSAQGGDCTKTSSFSCPEVEAPFDVSTSTSSTSSFSSSPQLQTMKNTDGKERSSCPSSKKAFISSNSVPDHAGATARHERIMKGARTFIRAATVMNNDNEDDFGAEGEQQGQEHEDQTSSLMRRSKNFTSSFGFLERWWKAAVLRGGEVFLNQVDDGCARNNYMVDSTKNATASATSSCFSGSCNGGTNSTKVDQHSSLKQLEQQEPRPSSGSGSSVFFAPSGRSGSRTPPRPGKRRAVWSGSAKNTTGVLDEFSEPGSGRLRNLKDGRSQRVTKRRGYCMFYPFVHATRHTKGKILE
ncbi:unnamed protein product [Amoebophrya sp. A120]|nr:unnamed protein product [Amoebophrya sp. A120]|eukprot:GSA120T00022442001.1